VANKLVYSVITSSDVFIVFRGELSKVIQIAEILD
jgi:hypothetical protein